MSGWRDKVNDKLTILATAQVLTDRGECYIVNRYRYGDDLHRRALYKLKKQKLLKLVEGGNPYLYFQITDLGKQELLRMKKEIQDAN